MAKSKPRLRMLGARIAELRPRVEMVSAKRQRALETNSTRWRRIRLEVLQRDCYTCRTCGRIAGRKREAHVDHVDGDPGNNELSNLQTLCAPCHSAKTVLEDGGFGNPRGGKGSF